MGILDKIAKNLGYTKSTANRTVELSNLYKFLGIDTHANDGVMSEATYFACMKVLSESVGKLPLKLQQHNEKNGVTIRRDHPLYRVLHDRPNQFMSASTFWSTVEFNRNHYGNAYVWIRGAGDNLSLWILPSNEVTVYYDDKRILADVSDVYYEYSAGGRKYLFSSEEILHFKSFKTYDGIVGLSVQDQLRDTLQGAIKSQQMINKMYDTGFVAKAVLNYTGNLSDANVQELVSMTNKYANGDGFGEQVGSIIPMPLGFTMTPLNIKLADNQFIEVRQYSALSIASCFGIKPYQIGDYTKSSYASAEAQQLSFYVDTLLYILKHYEEELSYKLLSDEERAKGLHFKFNISVILRADLSTQIDTLTKGVAGFIYTPNEARAMLDLEAKDGGDKLLGNGASIPVELAGTQYGNNVDTTTSEEDD